MSDSAENLALASCAQEPIHIPGRIQSYGYCLSVAGDELTVTHASENLSALPSVELATCLGRPLRDIVQNRELLHAIRGSQSLPSVQTHRERIGVFDVAGDRLDVAVSGHPDGYNIELEPIRSTEPRPVPGIARLQSLLANIPGNADLDTLLESGCRALRHLSGIDRIMAYRFFENGDGEVVAEAKAPRLESYLGLRYPASDIPEQARALMLRVPFRLIADVADPHAGIVALPNQPPLDLSLTHLRGVSPIHTEYLSNMGVSASMNLAIAVRGELWGMFALHHYVPKLIDADRRSTCELFGQLLSFNIQQAVEEALLRQRRRVNSVLDAIRTAARTSIPQTLAEHGSDLLETLSASGLAVVSQGASSTHGEVPESAALERICKQAGEQSLALDALGSVPGLEDLATPQHTGVLCTPLAADTNAWLMLFRPEIDTEIRWAGSPEKNIDHGPNGPRLTPRASFAEYRQQVAGRCRPWTQSDTMALLEMRTHFLRQLFANTAQRSVDYERSMSQQHLIIAELNHRVKNILSLVRSVAGQSKKNARNLNEYVVDFEDRLKALSRAHDLVGAHDLQGASLRELLDLELSPHQHSDTTIDIDGPSLRLRPEAIPTFCLIIHELVSNAVKYGALGPKGISLEVCWETDAGGVRLIWQERVLEPIASEPSRGFGLSLIERAVPYEFEGTCEVQLNSAGLKATFWLPSHTVSGSGAEPMRANRPTVSEAVQYVTASTAAHCILVVEDHALLAMQLEDTLLELGYPNSLSCSDTQDAREAIAQQRPDLAILDVHLEGETSVELAIELATEGIPLLFLSGYETLARMPDTLAQVPWLQKPASKDELRTQLAKVFG